MMNIRKNKTIVCIVTTLLIIAGSFLMGTPAGTVEASETTAISEKVLSVKCQLSEDKTKLRMVTTVDEQLQYKNVGFEVTFLGDDDAPEKTKTNTAKYVYRRINATDATVKYEFGPKAFNAASEWIATYTITKIPEEYLDNGIIIKPYVTMKDTLQKVYGEHRYLTMLDQDNGVVSLPVKGELTNPTVAGATVKETYFDGTYTHVRVSADYATLPSISTYAVTDNGTEYTERYRYLHSTVSSDQSWYNNSDADDKVIVTAGDMRGFQVLSKTNNFATDTIYLGADIDLNPGFDASTYSYVNTQTTTRPDNANDWNPIGCSGVTADAQSYPKFAGTFDGDMHSISGVFSLKWISGRNALGLFGEVEGATIKNFTLKNSYFYLNGTKDIASCMGSVVGVLDGTLDTVKSDETVFVEIANASQYNGGLVGKATNGMIQNCWFAGKISAGAAMAHTGGLLGGLPSSGNQCTITNCLFTGKIDARANTGGLVGSAWTGSTLTIDKTLYAGEFVSITDVSPYNIGTVLGNAKENTTTATDVYYGTDTIVTDMIGSNVSNSTDEISELDRTTDLVGHAAYLNMDVDFYIKGIHESATWAAMEESTPVLTKFADKTKAVDLTQTQGIRTFWYEATDGADTYVLYTPADFRGFQELSKTVNFASDTVKLGADINLNPGFDASTYSYVNSQTTTRPSNTNDWNPIGCSGVTVDAQSYPKFAGTFDGDMHSISGVFSLKWISGRNALGLFGEVEGATIKNFTLKNSYFYLNGTKDIASCMGSVVGVLDGTLDTVKSDETVFVEIANASQYNGGLVGKATNGMIQNCWFAGKISAGAAMAHTGGLLGGLPASGNQCTITNSLFTGKIDARSNAGGLVGAAWTGSTLTIDKTLYAGEFVSITGVSPYNIGTVLGNAKANTTTASDVYIGIDSVVGGIIGSNESSSNSTASVYKLNRTTELVGNVPYGIMNIDFYEEDRNESGIWFAMEESNPILTSFADKSNPVDLTTAQGTRTYWFDAENPKDSYTLYSPAELRGFQVLSATNNFHNIEIKLGKDIDLNPGWTVEDGTPDTVWTPIGRSAIDTSVIIPFRGTFNGQGHTIKGVYVNSSSDRIGLFATTGQDAVIQNFTLENSAIYGTKESGTGSVGSIVGRLGGTLDTVKSSADVILSGCEYAGGMVGDINSTVGATITNCWFAGNMGGTGSHHGQILGGVRNVSGSDDMNTCTVTHCLATGSIAFKGNTGGLVGTLWGGSTLNISDTLFAGTFLDVTNSGNHGAVVGNAPYAQSVTVNVTNVYVQKGSGIADTKIIGNVGDSTHNEAQKANVTYVEVKELYLDDARENTALTIYPQGQDSSSDGDNKQYWWYVSETHPILASFGETVEYTKLKVATYNIGSCIKLGTDYHESVRADVVSFIKNNNIDVCLLQEVDKDCARTYTNGEAVDQAQAIAAALGYEYTYVPTLENHYSGTYGQVTSYGIAIVSRYEITSTDYEYVNFGGQNEKRAILKAMVDVNGTETAVICTHFDNASDTTVRTNAVATLKTMIDGLDASTPVIFGGDLNQAYAGEETVAIKELGAFLNSVTKARYDAKTTMAGSTWYQLDYIFTNALVECGRAKVYTPTSTTVEGELSDHRPLVVNLYMNIK